MKLFRKQKYSKALFSVFAQNEFYYSSFIESMSHLQEPTHNYEKQFQRWHRLVSFGVMLSLEESHPRPTSQGNGRPEWTPADGQGSPAGTACRKTEVTEARATKFPRNVICHGASDKQATLLHLKRKKPDRSVPPSGRSTTSCAGN